MFGQQKYKKLAGVKREIRTNKWQNYPQFNLQNFVTTDCLAIIDYSVNMLIGIWHKITVCCLKRCINCNINVKYAYNSGQLEKKQHF